MIDKKINDLVLHMASFGDATSIKAASALKAAHERISQLTAESESHRKSAETWRRRYDKKCEEHVALRSDHKTYCDEITERVRKEATEACRVAVKSIPHEFSDAWLVDLVVNVIQALKIETAR